MSAARHLHGVREQLAEVVQADQIARRIQVLLSRSPVTQQQQEALAMISAQVVQGQQLQRRKDQHLRSDPQLQCLLRYSRQSPSLSLTLCSCKVIDASSW